MTGTEKSARKGWGSGNPEKQFAKGKNMIAHYGFKDGSGEWFVVIDTDRCNGCGECVKVCPPRILEVGPDDVDIFREEPVAFVKQEERKKIKYACAPCRPTESGKMAPCVTACKPGAISHSDAWELSFGQP